MGSQCTSTGVTTYLGHSVAIRTRRNSDRTAKTVRIKGWAEVDPIRPGAAGDPIGRGSSPSTTSMSLGGGCVPEWANANSWTPGRAACPGLGSNRRRPIGTGGRVVGGRPPGE